MFTNAEYNAAAIRYAVEELGLDMSPTGGRVNGQVQDPLDGGLTRLVAIRTAEGEFSLLIQPYKGKLEVISECSIEDFLANGGHRIA